MVRTEGDVALNFIATCKVLGGAWEVHANRSILKSSVEAEMRERSHWNALLPPVLPALE